MNKTCYVISTCWSGNIKIVLVHPSCLPTMKKKICIPLKDNIVRILLFFAIKLLVKPNHTVKPLGFLILVQERYEFIKSI